MPSVPGLAEEARRDQMAVQAAALKQLLDVWGLVDPLDPWGTAAGWARTAAGIVATYRGESARRAVRAYEQMRALQAPLARSYTPPTPTAVNVKALRHRLVLTGPGRVSQLVKQGSTPSQAHRDAIPVMAGTATKQILDAGRAVHTRGSEDDPEAVGYARLPRPKACAFCLMLASRGAVYTRSTVVTTTGRAPKRGSNTTYHDHCSCEPFAVYSHDTDLPKIIVDADTLWTESTQGLSGKEALAAFRVATGETPGTRGAP